jgi:hypothetical protein
VTRKRDPAGESNLAGVDLADLIDAHGPPDIDPEDHGTSNGRPGT